MFGIYTQFGLSSNDSYNRNCTIPYFINLITDRANFAVSGPTSLYDVLFMMSSSLRHKTDRRCKIKKIKPTCHTKSKFTQKKFIAFFKLLQVISLNRKIFKIRNQYESKSACLCLYTMHLKGQIS